MAKPSLFKSIKLKRLMRATGLPLAHAIGHLECLWHVAYERAEPLIGDADDVELAAEWEGKPGVLVAALYDAGFLDRVGDADYAVHNLLKHAPDYVRKRHQRAHPTKNKDLGEKPADNGGQQRTAADNGAYPPPTPPYPADSAAAGAAAGDGKLFGGVEHKPPTRKRRDRPKPGPPSEQAALIRAHRERWADLYGTQYPFKGGRDAKAAKSLIDECGRQGIAWADVVDRYFADVGGLAEKRKHPLHHLADEIQIYITPNHGASNATHKGIHEGLTLNPE